MTVHTSGLAEGQTVYIDNTHIDVSIKAELEQANGMMQDTMDDRIHNSLLYGFYINDKTNYINSFAISGLNETLIEGWGFVFGTYGSASISEKRLTEYNLKYSTLAYANKVQVVYDLLIKNKDDTEFHSASVMSEFIIPVKVLRCEKDGKFCVVRDTLGAFSKDNNVEVMYNGKEFVRCDK
jgi:hypothetical protein